jgi:hypothetical protein
MGLNRFWMKRRAEIIILAIEERVSRAQPAGHWEQGYLLMPNVHILSGKGNSVDHPAKGDEPKG